jgi:hypothetical protein
LSGSHDSQGGTASWENRRREATTRGVVTTQQCAARRVPALLPCLRPYGGSPRDLVEHVCRQRPTLPMPPLLPQRLVQTRCPRPLPDSMPSAPPGRPSEGLAAHTARWHSTCIAPEDNAMRYIRHGLGQEARGAARGLSWLSAVGTAQRSGGRALGVHGQEPLGGAIPFVTAHGRSAPAAVGVCAVSSHGDTPRARRDAPARRWGLPRPQRPSGWGLHEAQDARQEVRSAS